MSSRIFSTGNISTVFDCSVLPERNLRARSSRRFSRICQNCPPVHPFSIWEFCSYIDKIDNIIYINDFEKNNFDNNFIKKMQIWNLETYVKLIYITKFRKFVAISAGNTNVHWCIDCCTLLIPPRQCMFRQANEIHEIWTLLSIYNTGRVRHHCRSVQYLKNSFVNFDCLRYSRFSRNLSGLRWPIFTRKGKSDKLHHVIAPCPIRTSRGNQFSPIFFCFWNFDVHTQSKELHDAVCHSLPVRLSNFHFLLCAFLGYKWRFYYNGFLFE